MYIYRKRTTGHAVGAVGERRTTQCANEQLDFILSLGINCSCPASERRRTQVEVEPGLWQDGAICCPYCDSLRKWPIGVNWPEYGAQWEGAHLHTT